MTVFQAIELALQHQRAGRLAEAESIYRQILAIHPNDENSLHLLGMVASQRGQQLEAAGLISRAIEVNPKVAEFHNNLAVVHTALRRHEAAIECCQRALQLNPTSPEIYNNLGNALRDQGRHSEAISAYRTALQYRPNFAAAHNNLGIALRHEGRFDEAVSACQTALRFQPNFPEAYNNLGTALEAQSRIEAALGAYRAALQLRPDLAETHNNLGNALTALGRIDEGLAEFAVALRLAPAYEEARFNCSLAMLLAGDYEHAWPFYESRWNALNLERRHFTQPTWDGSPLDGRRLLIYTEQGFGDSIQFIRYVRLAAASGGEVIVECQPPLFELFRDMPGCSHVIASGDPLPAFDLHLPMLSQPLVHHTTATNIPHEVPYLSADPARTQAWTQRLGSNGTQKRIGLVWAGNPENRRSRQRDIPFDALSPLLAQNAFRFISLQVGDRRAELRLSRLTSEVFDGAPYLKDFADTAALLTQLDLLISADTAAAHLAGAMARPVWTLLPSKPDWRWGLRGENTPWYPTMRLFRQAAAGDWTSVIEQVSAELTRWNSEQ
jgi:tetratricopeptide (TPR) repeat protein